MGEPNMEGVENRLQETHDPIEVPDTEQERRDTAVADIEGIEQVVTPPRSLIKVLEGREGAQCGQAFELVWQSGEWKGLPVTGYCAEPICINTGSCTGTRFVPHVDQWDSTLTYQRQRRKMTPSEMIAASRMFAKQAALQTGRDEERTDKEILDHIRLVWRKTLEAIRDKGGEWRR